ncbi:MAG: hypothetical protein V4669_02735 [Pseudomonadota bacterium]
MGENGRDRLRLGKGHSAADETRGATRGGAKIALVSAARMVVCTAVCVVVGCSLVVLMRGLRAGLMVTHVVHVVHVMARLNVLHLLDLRAL